VNRLVFKNGDCVNIDPIKIKFNNLFDVCINVNRFHKQVDVLHGNTSISLMVRTNFLVSRDLKHLVRWSQYMSGSTGANSLPKS
jgi:hypothetical protein